MLYKLLKFFNIIKEEEPIIETNLNHTDLKIAVDNVYTEALTGTSYSTLARAILAYMIFKEYGTRNLICPPTYVDILSLYHDGELPKSQKISKESSPEHYHDKNKPQPVLALYHNFSKERCLGFLHGNVIKYCTRFGRKDRIESELKKILRFSEFYYLVDNNMEFNPDDTTLVDYLDSL